MTDDKTKGEKSASKQKSKCHAAMLNDDLSTDTARKWKKSLFLKQRFCTLDGSLSKETYTTGDI